MIKGMTGFGYREFSFKDVRGMVEIKSLNHRYLDISFYLPVGFASIENKIRNIIARRVKRGRINISLKITNRPKQVTNFNKDSVQKYIKYSKTLKKEFGLAGELSVSELVQMPGVIETRETQIHAEALWPAVVKSVNDSLRSLEDMRKEEGRSLNKEMRSLLKRMSLQTNRIRARAKTVSREKRKKLQDEEFVSYSKGTDVAEEITRLSHHIDVFRKLLSENSGVGKKLDFVAQEMQRETNTIGSKLQDKIVANAVVALKSKIEKLREQSQNIE